MLISNKILTLLWNLIPFLFKSIMKIPVFLTIALLHACGMEQSGLKKTLTWNREIMMIEICMSSFCTFFNFMMSLLNLAITLYTWTTNYIACIYTMTSYLDFAIWAS